MDRKDSTPDHSPVALEDLLKLKRLEKPDTAFWSSFDREFEKKTLKELVKKPSMREAFAHWLSTSGSRWIPASAVAAAAVFFASDAFVTSQESQAPALISAPQQITNAVEIAATEPAPQAKVSATTPDILPADDAVWTEAETDFTVDFIVASNPVASGEPAFSTDFAPDTLEMGYAAPTSYAEKVYTSNLATLYPDAFRLGM